MAKLVDLTGKPIKQSEPSLDEQKDALLNLVTKANSLNAPIQIIIPTNPPVSMCFTNEDSKKLYDCVAEVVVDMFERTKLAEK